MPEPEAFVSVFTDPAQPTIIGGQAVNYWAAFYSEAAPELEKFRPFISKDADLWADRRTVVALRDRTGWKCQFFDEPRTHAVALLTKQGPGGEELRIEVLKDVYGLTPDDLARSAVLETPAGNVRVLEPAQLLKGKIATLASFKSENRPNDVRHIRLLLPINRVHLESRITATEQGQIPAKETIAALRCVAELGATPTARALAELHGFDFATAIPPAIATTADTKIRNFAHFEFQQIAARYARITAAGDSPAPALRPQRLVDKLTKLGPATGQTPEFLRSRTEPRQAPKLSP